MFADFLSHKAWFILNTSSNEFISFYDVKPSWKVPDNAVIGPGESGQAITANVEKLHTASFTQWQWDKLLVKNLINDDKYLIDRFICNYMNCELWFSCDDPSHIPSSRGLFRNHHVHFN